MFSGIGGFELGIQRSCIKDESEGIQRIGNSQGQYKQFNHISEQRFTCVGHSEIDKYAEQVYQKQFGGKNYGDATKINTDELPDFDMLCGGFPCQAFSIAGNRRGFKDTRGTLFFEIARIAKAKQPRLLFLENVKGLLNHDKGETFTKILQTLDELGYGVQWQVLNSKHFGVPQNRERVFIIGHLRGTRRPEVFPIGQSINTGSIQGRQICKALLSNYPRNSNGNYISTDSKPEIGQAKRKYDTKRVSPPLSQNWQPIIKPEIRRLTPTECERLQGFPDGWTEGLSDTQRYKCLGNAVTVNIIRAIFQRLR